MTNKNYYAAMIISDGEKNYPTMQKFDKFDNIAHFFQGRRDIVAANILPTKKEAAAVVMRWREDFRKNGTYMFDDSFCENTEATA